MFDLRTLLIAVLLNFGLSRAHGQYYNLQGMFKNQSSGSQPDTWTGYNPSGPPTSRAYHTAIWTGAKMIVWGGNTDSNIRLNTGGIYDPVTNSWATVSTTSAPTARWGHVAAWTGSKMIIWGGCDGTNFYNTGGIYDPSSDSWTATTTTSAPTARCDFSGVWTGSQLIVWGGDNNGTKTNTGGKYNPATDAWTATTTTSAPTARYLHNAVWSGSEMIVWGGNTGGTSYVNSGANYKPADDTWTATSTGANLPTARQLFGKPQWTGTDMIVWGGYDSTPGYTNTGAKYNLSGNSWSTVTTTSAPSARQEAAVIWTGAKMFVWGGYDGAALATGALYDNSGNSWTAINTTGSPSARYGHSAVWTGTKVLIWGGQNISNDTNVYAYTIDPPGSLTLTVNKVYPTNGLKWNDYVKNNNGGTNPHNQKDQACAGTETGSIMPCIHGGEKLKVSLTGYSTCSGFAITDALGVFKWSCEVSNNQVTFYTTGFKDGKGLADLINATSWKNNSVTVTLNSVSLGTSTSTTWWTNTVAPLPANIGTGSATINLDGTDNDGAGNDQAYTSGTILTLSANQNSSGYNINMDKLSIVILPGATLTFNNHVNNNCNYTTGETASPQIPSLICTGAQKYIWIEGKYNGGSVDLPGNLVTVVNTKMSRIHKAVLEIANYEVLYFTNNNYNMVSDLTIADGYGSWSQLNVEASDYNLFNKVRISGGLDSNGIYYAIDLNYGSDNNIFNDLAIMNTNQYGLYISGGNNNTFTRATISNAQSGGIYINGYQANSDRNTINHATIINPGGHGITLEDSTYGGSFGTFNQIVVGNSDGSGNGLNLFSSASHKFSQLALAHNTKGMFLSQLDNTTFTNNALLGNNSVANCEVYLGTNPGVTGSCTNQGTSNANWITGSAIDFTTSFVGKVTSDSNTADSSGTASYSAISDWILFDNFFRGWGKSGGAFPSANNQGACVAGDTCQIWDWRLKSTDTVIRNKSYDGSTANGAFTAGSACPAAVSGNLTLTDQNSSPRTFLVNATEIIYDDIGNDNGLCESGEACIYSPNFGAYQGEGDYAANGTCLFQNGTVKNVTMYAYPTNGG